MPECGQKTLLKNSTAILTVHLMNKTALYYIAGACLITCLLTVPGVFAQSGAPFLKKNVTDQILAYEPPAEADVLELTHDDIYSRFNNQESTPENKIGGAFGLCSLQCAEQTYIGGHLNVQLDLGEDYEFAKAFPEPGPIEVILSLAIGYRAGSAGSLQLFPGHTATLCTLAINVNNVNDNNPERRAVVDLSSELQSLQYCDSELRVIAKVIGYSNPQQPITASHLRLRFWMDTETVVEGRASGQLPYPVSEPAVLERVQPSLTTVSTNPVHFEWDGITCEPNFPLYQLQILRLYNFDEMTSSNEKEITTDLNWDEALTLEVLDNSVSLTLAEDRGYYIWRVRPIGNAEPQGILNTDNWGVWTGTPAQTAGYTIQLTALPSPIADGIFFYDGFEETRNWSFQRSHADHGQFVESIQFATSMLRVEQSQVLFQSQNERIISQSLYDNVGRPALQTLPLPYFDSQDGKQLAYLERSELMTVSGADYRTEHFDDLSSGTFENPLALDGGALHAYYSGGVGSEDHVASAEGYPFVQTQYYGDGTNSPREASGPGAAHRMGGGHTSENFFIRPTEKELIALFGEEAPDKNSVRKVVGKDPNGTSSVSYYSKSGALLAAGMVKNTSGSSNLANLDVDPNSGEQVMFPASDPQNPIDEGLVAVDLLDGKGATADGKLRLAGQEILLTETTNVDLFYSTQKKTFYDDCLEMCTECDFMLVIRVLDLKTNKIVNLGQQDEMRWGEIVTPGEPTFGADQASCASQQGTLYWPGPGPSDVKTIQLAPGAYRIEREVIFEMPLVESLQEGYSQSRLGWYRQQVRDRIYELIDGLDSGPGDVSLSDLEDMFFTAEAMKNTDDLDDFYTYLKDYYGGRYWELPCGTLEIPFEECKEEEIPPVQDWIAYMANILGTTQVFGPGFGHLTPTNSDRMAFYCGVGNATGPHPAHPGLNSISDADLATLLNNILAAHPGEEAALWGCWQSAVQQRARLPLRNDRLYCTSLLDLYFDCIGYEPTTIHANATDYNNAGGVVLAHTMFVDPTANCAADLTAVGLDPATQEYRDAVYRCLLTSTTNSDGDQSLDDDIRNKSTGEFESECLSSCDQRYQEFRDAILLAFQINDPTITENDFPLDDLTEDLVAKCKQSCDVLNPLNQPGIGANQIEYDEFTQLLESVGNFMFQGVEVRIKEIGEDCPEGFDQCGADPILTDVDWSQIADERNVILELINQAIENARDNILTTGDVAGELSSLRNYIEAQFFAMTRQAGCPGLWPYDDGINSAAEGISQAVFEQMLALQQQGKLNSFIVRLSVDEANCDLNMSVVLSFGDSCPPMTLPSSDHFGSNLDEYTSAEIACLIEADAGSSGQPYCQMLCSEFCKVYDPSTVSLCVNFIDAEEFAKKASAGTEIREKSCGELMLPRIKQKMYKRLNNLIARRQQEVEEEYVSNCLLFKEGEETFTATYSMNYYHFTLYYYDRAGRLIKTIPPKGVDFQDPDGDRSQVPNHTLATTYAYNSIGELLATNSPDGGLSKFYYNEAGQLLVSQNAEQFDAGNTTTYGKHSFTEYDEFGRPFEAGEGDDFADAVDGAVNNIVQGSVTVSNKSEITKTFYDEADANGDYTYLPGGAAPTLTGRNYRHRVARAVSNYGDVNKEVSTSYSYDEHGNVEWVIQDLPNMTAQKYVRYEFNLLSGNTEKVILNEGYVDQFHHCYGYDADNRLTEVWTSDDGEFWDRDAAYEFYKHGGMRRTEIGEDRVQGLDYVYTIHGWLKAINYPVMDPNSDPGEDGKTPTTRVAQDAFGMMLGYYQNDYVRSGSVYELSSPHLRSTLSSSYDLYNGNIASMQVGHSAHAQVKYGTNAGEQTGYAFQYDQLQRLISADFRAYQSSAWTDPANSEFDATYKYDPNGNLTKLQRFANDALVPLMDDFTYNYIASGNRLNFVADAQTNSAAYAEDIDNQTSGNYSYDEIGRLTGDNAEGITNIEWTAYHTVEQITYSGGRTVNFIYDATGQRIQKRELVGTVSTVTHYVRDAVGTVLATYVDHPDEPSPGDVVVENPIYGAGRVGVQSREFFKGTYDLVNTNYPVLIAPVLNIYERTICEKMYELTDHLGNVRVVISDIKVGASGGVGPFTADVHVINNYYPFGMLQPGRHVQSETYRYGFGGHEADHELKGAGNSYTTTFRQYDPRLGRWLSVDPVVHPWQSPYVGYDNNPVYYADPSGASTKKESTPIQDNSGAGSSNSGSGNTMLDFFRFLDLDIATQTINPGDTFWDIENQLGLDHGSLQAWNPNLDPRTLQVGQEIITGDPFSSLDEAARNGQLPMFESDDIFMGIRTFDEPWLGNSGQLADDWFSPKWLIEKSILVSNGLVGTASWIILVKGQYFSSNEIWHLFVGKRNATLRDRIMFRWTKTSHGRSKWTWGGAVNSRNVQALRVEKIRNIGNGFAIASGVLIGADIVLSGELKPSHIVNGIMVVLSTTGWGAIVAGVWFVADYGTLGATWLFTDDAQSISDMLDESIGTVQMWDPLLEGQK